MFQGNFVELGGPGFLPQEGDDFNALRKSVCQPREAYSTPQALETFKAAIIERLEAKNHHKYAGFVLVIPSPFETLPRERWDGIMPDLRQEAARLPFKEVYAVSDGSGDPYGFQLK